MILGFRSGFCKSLEKASDSPAPCCPAQRRFGLAESCPGPLSAHDGPLGQQWKASCRDRCHDPLVRRVPRPAAQPGGGSRTASQRAREGAGWPRAVGGAWWPPGPPMKAGAGAGRARDAA